MSVQTAVSLRRSPAEDRGWEGLILLSIFSLPTSANLVLRITVLAGGGSAPAPREEQSSFITGSLRKRMPEQPDARGLLQKQQAFLPHSPSKDVEEIGLDKQPGPGSLHFLGLARHSWGAFPRSQQKQLSKDTAVIRKERAERSRATVSQPRSLADGHGEGQKALQGPSSSRQAKSTQKNPAGVSPWCSLGPATLGPCRTYEESCCFSPVVHPLQHPTSTQPSPRGWTTVIRSTLGCPQP